MPARLPRKCLPRPVARSDQGSCSCNMCQMAYVPGIRRSGPSFAPQQAGLCLAALLRLLIVLPRAAEVFCCSRCVPCVETDELVWRTDGLCSGRIRAAAEAGAALAPAARCEKSPLQNPSSRIPQCQFASTKLRAPHRQAVASRQADLVFHAAQGPAQAFSCSVSAVEGFHTAPPGPRGRHAPAGWRRRKAPPPRRPPISDP